MNEYPYDVFRYCETKKWTEELISPSNVPKIFACYRKLTRKLAIFEIFFDLQFKVFCGNRLIKSKGSTGSGYKYQNKLFYILYRKLYQNTFVSNIKINSVLWVFWAIRAAPTLAILGLFLRAIEKRCVCVCVPSWVYIFVWWLYLFIQFEFVIYCFLPETFPIYSVFNRELEFWKKPCKRVRLSYFQWTKEPQLLWKRMTC